MTMTQTDKSWIQIYTYETKVCNKSFKNMSCMMFMIDINAGLDNMKHDF